MDKGHILVEVVGLHFDMKPFGCFPRYFDLRELFPVQFGQQVNQTHSYAMSMSRADHRR